MKNTPVILILLVLPFALMWQLFTPNQDSSRMMTGDILIQAYPSRHLMHQYHNAGQQADWNPYQMSGMPFSADVQVAPFYLPNLVFHWILTGQSLSYRALEALVVFHYSLAGLFCYLYLNSLGVHRGASSIGALAFEFNGFFVGHRGHYNMFASAVWTMASLWTMEKLFQSETTNSRILWTVGTAAAVSQMATAGHPQQAFYGTLFLLAFALYRSWGKSQLTRLSWFGLAGCLSAGLSAVALLPAAELLLVSDRSQPTLAFAQEYSLLPRNFIALIIPEFSNWSGTEFRIYPGLLTLVLASLAVFFGKQRHQRFFVGTLCICTFASLGGFTALHSLLYLLCPGFSSIRVSSRIFFFSNLALCVLTAFGAESLIKGSFQVGRVKELIGFWKVLAVAIGGGLLFVYSHFLSQNTGVSEAFYTRGMFEPASGLESVAGLTQCANSLMLALIFLASSIAIVSWGLRRSCQKNVWVLACCALLIVDLGTFAVRHDTIEGNPTELLYQEKDFHPRLLTAHWERNEHRELVRRLQQLPAHQRIDNRKVLPANSGQIYGLRFWDGYNILDVKDRVDLRNRSPKVDIETLHDLFGVGYVLTLPNSSDSQLCSEGPYRLLFENSQGQIWARKLQPTYATFHQNLREVSSIEAVRHYLALEGQRKTSVSHWPLHEERAPRSIGTTGQNSPFPLSLSSAGSRQTSCITVDGDGVWMGTRGLSMVCLDPDTGNVALRDNFDTYLSQFESRRLARTLATLKKGTIVLISSSDEGFSQLEDSGRQALKSLGAELGPTLSSGNTYCLIGVVGAPENSALESYHESENCQLDLGQPFVLQEPGTAELEFQILEQKHNRISLWVRNENPGLLVLKESFYPGWQVQIDGKPAIVNQAEGLFLSTVLASSPPEGHLVSFRFESPTLQLGRRISRICALFIIFLLASTFLRQPSPRTPRQ